MRRFIALTLTAIICLSLSGCLVHHINVQQGNIFSESDIQAIHKGMTRRQVIHILGQPVLNNIYRNNQLIYVYTFKPNHGKFFRKSLIIQFRNGVVAWKKTNVYQPGVPIPLP